MHKSGKELLSALLIFLQPFHIYGLTLFRV